MFALCISVLLRLVPNYRSRHISKILPSLQARCTLFSAAANSIQNTAEYEDSDKAIDFNNLFKSCNQLHLAKCLHAYVEVSGKAQSILISTKLVNIYAYLGDVSFSRRTFNQIPIKDVYTWNSMVSTYVRSGHFREAADCFYQFFLTSCLRPDFYTFAPVLKACSARKLFDDMPVRDMGSWNAMISGYCQNGNAAEALDVLNEMRLEGVMMNPVTIASSILPICAQLEFDLYAKFGKLEHAHKVFDHMVVRDVVSWNSIIAAYEQNDDPNRALGLFYNMQLIGTSPDYLTLVSLSSIFAQLSDCRSGKSVHGFVMRRGWILKDVISANSVVDMYAKLGVMDYARAVFVALPVKDVVYWNTLITGYAQNGLARALQQGMRVHGQLIKNSLYLDIFVGTCLIDMYGKCEKLDDVMSLFLDVPKMTSVPWNAIISSHGIHGHAEKALKLFREMPVEGVKPDHITFVFLLSACSHSGLAEEGQWCFHVMQEEIHGNIDLGAFASDRLFEVDSENVGYYVLLSNIYANSGKWEGVDKVRALARDRGLRKIPGWSSIEVNNKVDVFYTGNQSHPKCEELYKELRSLTAKMKNLGYVPDYCFVLQDVEEDEEFILMSHSERLTIAFGIINTPPKSPIRIFKNLRVCGDCHNATKFISKITKREIIVRDSNRFHHFKDGVCTCGDYW
ncbi:hypothetical protein CRYUN_Cryun10bG0120200 [Craigia yunnanensis]